VEYFEQSPFEIAKNMIISEPQNEYVFGVRPSRWKFLNQKDELIEKHYSYQNFNEDFQ